MRLYRGLTRSLRSEEVGKGQGPFFGTDFTDCPLAVLKFARGRQGVVLVVDLPSTGNPRVSEEFWFQQGPKRLMIWGTFEEFLVAQIPAKELRAQIRRKGIVTQPDGVKSDLLETYIEQWIASESDGGNR